MSAARDAGRERAFGWTPEAIQAFADRSEAIHKLQQAERELAQARATYKHAQRAYEAAIDTMAAGRRALATATAEGGDRGE